MPSSDQRLIASAVYDQKNSYIGVVVKVNRNADGTFSLLLQSSDANAETEQFRLPGESIQHVDFDRKQVFADLERFPPMPVQVDALPLWQERVLVNRNRRKVGEISIRKAVEIHTVEIPIRSEKLIIEDVESADILTEVNLSSTEVTQQDVSELYSEDQMVSGHLTRFRDLTSFLEAVKKFPDNSFVKSKVTLTLGQLQQPETLTQVFESLDTALRVLACMDAEIASSCHTISLDLWVRDRERASVYQNWLSRYRQTTPEAQACLRPSVSRNRF